MTHIHSNPKELTIGCDACIERVKINEISCILTDWIDSLDPWAGDDDGELVLPKQQATLCRRQRVYRQLRNQGYDIFDVREAIAAWLSVPGVIPT